MNSLLYTVTLCTILLAIMCNFDEINAVPSPNSTKPAAQTKPAPPTPQPAKPVAATPGNTSTHPTVTKRPHDERGVIAASIAPIILGLLGQGIGYIM
uniref:SJCHGC03803 protein n=1 Tax=Schistosoma japonicum TaxID=6182 RepID=Q5BSM1_SCHJA|nr:SJCHGC03803 protein [Schistosoma japonicum]